MVVIGLLLLVVAVAFSVDLVWKNHLHIGNPTVFGERLGIHSGGSLFVLGAIVGAVALLGLAVLAWGLRRTGARVVGRRHERGELRRLRQDRDQPARTGAVPVTDPDETDPMTRTDETSDRVEV